MSNELHPFARLAHREGQRLTADDLRAEKSYEDRLRWLHVVGLHSTWGIVSGLNISGMIGDRMLTVGPGYAVDEAGRDLLLAGETKIPVPDILGPAVLVLVMSYRADTKFRRNAAELAQVCLHEPEARPLEQPEFSWQPAMDAHFGLQVPLIKVEVSGGVVSSLLGGRVRRYARREGASIIGWGSTEPGRTAWTLEKHPDPDPSPEPVWLQVEVDTSEAGFTQVPHYFAFLRGHGVNKASRLKTDNDIRDALTEPESTIFLSYLGFIERPSVVGFTYKIIRRAGTLPAVTITNDQAEQLRWSIHWMGIESNSACPDLPPWFPKVNPFFGASMGRGPTPYGFNHISSSIDEATTDEPADT